jgi:hypothetical protein
MDANHKRFVTDKQIIYICWLYYRVKRILLP